MIDPQYFQWNRAISPGGNGIIVGADITQEYLLPWWWKHYIRHNSHPVTFIDFGLSQERKKWCAERGEIIPLRICSELFLAPKEDISMKFFPPPSSTSQGQTRPMFANPFIDKDSQFWTSRNAWFKKPFAMLQSPYERTIWLDCDCEVRGNIKDLFDYCSTNEVALRADVAKYPFLHYNGREMCYNSGVIVYQSGCSLFELWAKGAVEKNKYFYADDQLLTDIILEHNFPVGDLPDTFHRFYEVGEKMEGAIIYHWAGVSGKRAIQAQIFEESLKQLLPSDDEDAKPVSPK